MTRIQINERLSYEPETGSVYRIKSGAVVGTVDCRGYRTIQIGDRRIYAHRVAFLAMTGELPSGVVDHINGDKTDNRWSNLRDVTQSENMANRHGPQSNSQTGLIGAFPTASGFRAHITRSGKRRHLGYFQTAHEAHQAYMEAANEQDD